VSETWIRTYENDGDYIESLGDVSWGDAPLPYLWHHCKPQTRGWFGLNYTERCACGATRLSARGAWLNKNETRRGRRKQQQDAKAPKVMVNCHACGRLYEAIVGSHIAREGLCNDCWAQRLVARQD
jgi:hypothetical protein